MADKKETGKSVSGKRATAAGKKKSVSSVPKKASKTSAKSGKKAAKKKVKIPTQKMPPHFKQALIFQSMNVYDKAIPLYRKSLKADGKYISTYNNLAQCLISTGKKKDRDEARKLITRALKLDPGNLGSLHARALVQQADKDVAGAEQTYREILKIQPLNMRAVQNLSQLLYDAGKKDKARIVLETVLKNHPPDEHRKIYTEALSNLKTGKIATPKKVKKDKSKKSS